MTSDEAGPELIAHARDLYQYTGDNNIEIDDDAKASHGEDGVWVAAWVWVPDSVPVAAGRHPAGPLYVPADLTADPMEG